MKKFTEGQPELQSAASGRRDLPSLQGGTRAGQREGVRQSGPTGPRLLRSMSGWCLPLLVPSTNKVINDKSPRDGEGGLGRIWMHVSFDLDGAMFLLFVILG